MNYTYQIYNNIFYMEYKNHTARLKNNITIP